MSNDKLTPLTIKLGRAKVKQHCADYCKSINESKIPKRMKKAHYARAYVSRDSRLAILDRLEKEHLS